MNDVSLELHKINKNLERLIKVQKQQNDLLQQIINKPTYVPCVPNTPSNSDWLSALFEQGRTVYQETLYTSWIPRAKGLRAPPSLI